MKLQICLTQEMAIRSDGFDFRTRYLRVETVEDAKEFSPFQLAVRPLEWYQDNPGSLLKKLEPNWWTECKDSMILRLPITSILTLQDIP